MSHFVRDLPFGATLLEKNRTRFRLWAPQQAQMSVDIGEQIAYLLTAQFREFSDASHPTSR